MDSPIEDYLDELLLASSGAPRLTRGLLAETEAHLRDATAAGQAAGLDRVEAERRAVARFGTAREIAAAEARLGAVPTGQLARAGLRSALWLGSIGAVAVGVSGVLAAALGALWGSRFLVTAPTARDMTASACARWLAQANTHNCARAALADWTFETVGYRVALGIVGLLGLALWAMLRRTVRRGGATSLPAAVVDTIGALCFGAAGVWLVGMGVDALAVASGHGAGQWLSAAPVALVLAALFTRRLFQDLRRPSQDPDLLPSLAT